MIARDAAAPRARRALGLLLALLVGLSVLAHHELMPPMAGPAAATPMAHSAAPAAMPADEAGPRHASVAAVAANCGGSAGMCLAAGVNPPPLPAALPTGALLAPPVPPGGRVRPLPPGTGPPPPTESSSVLRI